MLFLLLQTERHLNDVVSSLSQPTITDNATITNNVTEECLANCEGMSYQMPIEVADAPNVLSKEQIYR